MGACRDEHARAEAERALLKTTSKSQSSVPMSSGSRPSLPRRRLRTRLMIWHRAAMPSSKALVTKDRARRDTGPDHARPSRALDAPPTAGNWKKLNISVATPLYGGPGSESDAVRRRAQSSCRGRGRQETAREKPTFDPKQPVTVRMAFLDGQKVETGMLPFQAVILRKTASCCSISSIPSCWGMSVPAS